MDADDVAHPERLARQVELLANDPSVSVASCLIETFGEGGVGPGMKIYEEWLNSLVTEADIGRDIFIESPIPHPSAVVSTAASGSSARTCGVVLRAGAVGVLGGGDHVVARRPAAVVRAAAVARACDSGCPGLRWRDSPCQPHI